MTISTGTGASRVVMRLVDGPQAIADSALGVDGDRVVQVAERTRGTHVETFDRGNRRIAMVVQGTRIHTTPYDALVFCMDHPEAVPTKGTVEIELSEGGRLARRYLQEAAVERVRLVARRGCTTVWEYSLRGSRIEKTET